MHHKLNMVSSLFSLRLNIYIHLGLTVVTINITADSSLSDYKGRYFRLSADVLHSESSSYIDKLDRCTCRSFLSFFLPLNKWQIKCKDHKMHVLHPLAANTRYKLAYGSYTTLKRWYSWVWLVRGRHGSGAALFHVGLEEHRCRRRAWQVSQTRTGLGDAGRGSSLSEQLLQKISPQFLQWCCRKRQRVKPT